MLNRNENLYAEEKSQQFRKLIVYYGLCLKAVYVKPQDFLFRFNLIFFQKNKLEFIILEVILSIAFDGRKGILYQINIISFFPAKTILKFVYLQCL